MVFGKSRTGRPAAAQGHARHACEGVGVSTLPAHEILHHFACDTSSFRLSGFLQLEQDARGRLRVDERHAATARAHPRRLVE